METTNSINYGERLSAAIKASGKTIAEVAEAGDIDRAYLYQLLKKDSMDVRYIEKVCRALDISPAAILGGGDHRLLITGVNNSQIGGASDVRIMHGCSGSEAEIYAQLLAEKERMIQHLQEELKRWQKIAESGINRTQNMQ